MALVTKNRLPGPPSIGGGRVNRTSTIAGRRVLPGEELTAEEIAVIPPNNRQALIDAGILVVWPGRPAEPAAVPLELHVVNLGFGKFDVIEGVKLNDGPVDAAEAERLSGKPVKAARKADAA